MKKEAKAKHDKRVVTEKKIQNDYRKECSKTGGGLGPAPLQEPDGDTISYQVYNCIVKIP